MLSYLTTVRRRLILTAGTKLRIAMVGRQITLMMGDVFAPATLAAIRRASSRVSSLAVERRPGHPPK